MRKTLVVGAALLLGPLGVAGLPAAHAGARTTVVATASATWQTNGTVWALAYSRGVVYAGGEFTRIRPPGAAPGSTREVAVQNLAAFDARTGAHLPGFRAHTFNAPVLALEASVDGATVYAGGSFTSVDGTPQQKVAGFATGSGTRTAFAPVLPGAVAALKATPDALYVGGAFLKANGATRTNVAAYSVASGALLPWAPALDNKVGALETSPDGSKVILGGQFDTVNGVRIHGLAAVTATTGASVPWTAGLIPATSKVRDLVVSGGVLYAGAEGSGGGVFDGTLAASPDTGAQKWRDNCLGATQAIAVLGGNLYTGSHAHDCSTVAGGFPEQSPRRISHLLAESTATGAIQPWTANTDDGPDRTVVSETGETVTRTGLGPRAMVSDGSNNLWVGGEFTRINGVRQQGLTRFTVDGPSYPPAQPAPVVTSTERGKVLVRWPAVEDRDDRTLTYTVYRNGTAVHTRSASSQWWSVPTLSFLDTVTPGTSYSYTVRASDGEVLSPMSTALAVTAASASAPYHTVMQSDRPGPYWRLSDAATTSQARDESGGTASGTYSGGTTRGVTGALPKDATNKAVTFNGLNGTVGADTLAGNPQSYTLDFWFKTTTLRGGKLVGMGNVKSGLSSNYSRHVYMNNAGQLLFGNWVGSPVVIKTAGRYNDGRYHHVIATLGPLGTYLQVDATLAARGTGTRVNGFPGGLWRVGGDNLRGWPEAPASAYFAGTVDEVAVYPYQFTGDQTRRHVTAHL